MSVANNLDAGDCFDPHFAFVGSLAVEYTNYHEPEDFAIDSTMKKIFMNIKNKILWQIKYINISKR